MSHPTSTDSRTGTYAVLLAPRQQGRIQIGRLGPLTLNGVEEVFLYVGSALGPGGVAARCRHHHRIASRPHWQLDSLRPYCDLIGVWVTYEHERLEHRWAQALGALPGARWPLPRFGASDCRCLAHLTLARRRVAGMKRPVVTAAGSLQNANPIGPDTLH